jgi:hypothetical protein
MSNEEYQTILIPIPEDSELEQPRRYCHCCTREDIFLTAYIITICAIILGGCIFILVWLIVNGRA